MDSIYKNGTYATRNPTWDVEDSAWKCGHILRLIQAHKLTPASVCDVGCGAGEVLSQLHQALPGNVEFVGFEISPQGYALAEARRKDRLSFVLGDFLSLNERRFDLLLAVDVVEHVEDCFGFLRRLRPFGSYAIFHIPLDIAAWKVLGGYLMTKWGRYGHIHFFTKETALATLRQAGFEIVDWVYTGLYQRPDTSNPAMRMLDVFRKAAYAVNPDLAVRWFGGFSLLVLAT